MYHPVIIHLESLKIRHNICEEEKRMKKRLVSLLAVMALTAVTTAGCGSSSKPAETTAAATEAKAAEETAVTETEAAAAETADKIGRAHV